MILELEGVPSDQGVASSRGESETAKSVASWAAAGRHALRQTHTFGDSFAKAIEGLTAIYQECHRPNWDGYGAEPVRDEMFWMAYRVIVALPCGIPAPGMGADPDGDITLEWHRSVWRTLSISVSADGSLHYAALFGSTTQYGTELFLGEVPRSILELIRRVQA